MTSPALRVVFDTVTLLQGSAKPQGPAGTCLRMAVDDAVSLYMSIDGLQELHDVLSRENVRNRFPLLTDERVEKFLEGLRDQVLILPRVPAVFRYARDPDDEHILNLAIACEAQFLVTRDNDLLDLMGTNHPEGQRLRTLVPRLVILTPPDFLHLSSGAKGESSGEVV